MAVVSSRAFSRAFPKGKSAGGQEDLPDWALLQGPLGLAGLQSRFILPWVMHGSAETPDPTRLYHCRHTPHPQPPTVPGVRASPSRPEIHRGNLATFRPRQKPGYPTQ